MVRHLHVPLQSGSDTVLKRMRRKYTMEHFSERLTKLHDALPDLAVTSDVIVGFPGETAEEFQETYDFIVKHKFSELHVFRIHNVLVHLLHVWMIKLMSQLK